MIAAISQKRSQRVDVNEARGGPRGVRKGRLYRAAVDVLGVQKRENSVVEVDLDWVRVF